MTKDTSAQNFSDQTQHFAFLAKLPSTVFRLANDGVMLTDSNRTIIDVNPSFEKITGYQRDDIIGRKPSLLSSDVHTKQFYSEMNDVLDKEGAWSGDIWNRHKNGSMYFENLSITVIPDTEGKHAYYLGILKDITEQRLRKEKLRQESLYDPLTHLPNRKMLSEKIERATEFAKKNDKIAGVFFLDLDGFKEVNDKFGHDIGDKVLIEIAKNLQNCLRDEDMIARLGGDEFAGVIFNVDNRNDCLPVLHRMLQAAAKPIKIQTNLISLSASIGVAFYSIDCVFDGEQLLRQADFAMYQAKQKGKNTFQLYDEAGEAKLFQSNVILAELANSIKNDQMVLFYQPKMNMVTNEITGVEALVRWRHSEQGLLSPGLFLPLIEEHQLSIELGYWVLEEALIQISEWQKRGFEIPVSVNVTSLQLHQDDFIANLMQLLTVYTCSEHHLLELEIVESSVIHDVDKVAKVIQKCRELGITVSLDDFGSGYSSLPYLRKLNVSKLKIDRSFIQNILTSTGDLSIIEAVITLASAFNCNVIAEGVENEEQGQLLMKLGCEEVQGFYIAKPMPSDDFLEWFSSAKGIPTWQYQNKLNQDSMLLTYAIVEHRGWMKNIIGYFQNQNDTLPELNHEKCLFCVWFSHSSLHANSSFMYKQVFSMHQRIHERAKNLYSVKDSVDNIFIIKELESLKDLSANFLEVLEANVESVS